MSSVALAFKENEQEMMTPILPAEVNGTGLNGQHVENKHGLLGVVASATPAANDEKFRLANDAIGVGQALNEPVPGVRSNMSDAAYLGSQVGNALSKATTGILGILGDEHAGNQKNEMRAGDQENRNKLVAPPPQMQMTASAPGFGGGPA